MSDLVTGEAVVLGLRTAKLPSRALARLLDGLIQVAGWFVLSIVVAMVMAAADEAAIEAIVLLVFVLLSVMVPIVVETLTKGSSAGKAALGLRVVRTDGGPIRFRHALVRGLVGVVDFGLFGAPAVISSLISPQGRRLGDVFAGTLVVRVRLPRVAREQGVLPPVPPQLLHAMSAELLAMEVSAVPDPLWLAIRQFLGRLRQLDAAVAASMAEQLAADLTAHTGRAVPYGVAPAAYLGAVLVERQRREWVRATAAGEIPQMYGAPYGQQPGVPAPQAQPYAVPQQAQGAPVRVLGYPAQTTQTAQATQAANPAQPVQPAAPVPAALAAQPAAARESEAGGFAPPA